MRSGPAALETTFHKETEGMSFLKSKPDKNLWRGSHFPTRFQWFWSWTFPQTPTQFNSKIIYELPTVYSTSKSPETMIKAYGKWHQQDRKERQWGVQRIWRHRCAFKSWWSLSNCVTLGYLLNLSVSHFLHLWGLNPRAVKWIKGATECQVLRTMPCLAHRALSKP